MLQRSQNRPSNEVVVVRRGEMIGDMDGQRDEKTDRENESLRASATLQSISGFALPSMHHRNQTSPLGFLSLKLLPPRCAGPTGTQHAQIIPISRFCFS